MVARGGYFRSPSARLLSLIKASFLPRLIAPSAFVVMIACMWTAFVAALKTVICIGMNNPARVRNSAGRVKSYLVAAGIEPEKKRKAMMKQFLEMIGRYRHGISVNIQIAELYVDESFELLGRSDPIFYMTPEWFTLRCKILRKYGRKCMKCGSIKNIAVDHIKPRSLHPDLELCEDNMQVLCRECNSSKSNKHETDYRPKPGSLYTYEPVKQ